MMTTENVIFMLAIPIGIMGVIAFVLLAGPMRPQVRRRLEWGMIGVFYPGMALYFAWRTVQLVLEAQDWISVALSAAMVCLMVWQGVVMVRKQVDAEGTRT
ncbi:hypothetical protein [Brevundimonas sp.]|uniref:hypothetical protein n=1 Tax=Brevundimonas sp. TaxID=1871086 RepID=UPI003D0EF576